MAKIIDKSKLVQRKNNGLMSILSGNTASRPTTNLNAGDLYFNTELECLQVYDGTTWVNLDPSDYTLPQANETTLGGIKASSRNSETDITEVKIDPSTGKLYVPESGGGGIPYGVTSGTNTAYTTTISGISSYTTGMVVAIKFDKDNLSNPTLNINGLGAKSILKNGGGVPTEDIKANDIYLLVYDGTYFRFTDKGDASGGGGVPEAPDYEGLYLRDGFNEIWIPTVEFYSKADFGDVEIDPYDKTSLLQFFGVALSIQFGQFAVYNGEGFTMYADAQFNFRLVDILNQKQEILTNIFGMAFNDEDPKWVDLKDLGSGGYSEDLIDTLDDSDTIDISEFDDYPKIRFELVPTMTNDSSGDVEIVSKEISKDLLHRLEFATKIWATTTGNPGGTIDQTYVDPSIVSAGTFKTYLDVNHPAEFFDVGDVVAGKATEEGLIVAYGKVELDYDYRNVMVSIGTGKIATISDTQMQFTAPTTTGISYQLRVIGIKF
jgi:hypothetical protein